jgi:hypothetical protein
MPAHLLVSAPVSVLLVVSRSSAMVLLVAPSRGAVGLAVAARGRALLVHRARGSHRLAGRVLVLRVVPAPVGRSLLVVAVALGARVVAAGGPTLAVAVVGAVAPGAVLTISVALWTGQQGSRRAAGWATCPAGQHLLAPSMPMQQLGIVPADAGCCVQSQVLRARTCPPPL